MCIRDRGSALRLHDRRRDFVSTRRHGRSRMERCRSGARRMEGAASAKVSQLCGRHLGTESGRRNARTGRPRLEDNRTMILAGDIGPTRTRLAAFETDANKLKLVVEKAYLSQKQPGLSEIIAEFIK